MARNKRAIPEINAGSMADIAFLLLIFYLVTTTMDTDKGINRKLPPIEDELVQDPPPIKERNIFTVLVNSNDQLLVEDEYLEINELRAKAMEFIDNNGDGSCEYCKGYGVSSSSDNPVKAVISLQNDRGTSYGMYVKVQNELLQPTKIYASVMLKRNTVVHTAVWIRKRTKKSSRRSRTLTSRKFLRQNH